MPETSHMETLRAVELKLLCVREPWEAVPGFFGQCSQERRKEPEV